MPIVEIKMLEGRTQAQKNELVRRITEVICEVADSDPPKVRVYLHEMPHNNYAIGGVMVSDGESK
jgi:4-oxalocrotonate tautomerase